MLKKRIIPVVLIDGFSVLKTIKFDVRRNLGSPITVLRTYNSRNVDELIILDIDANLRGDRIDHFIIREISDECFMPLTVGGGVCSLEDISMLLKNGADKVAINSSIFLSAEFARQAVEAFGAQCIVASADVKLVDGEYVLFNKGYPEVEVALLDWIDRVQSAGVGEILLTDVCREGTLTGLSHDLLRSVEGHIKVPLILVGGASSEADIATILQEEVVDAVGVSSLFHFTDTTPLDCALAAHHQGVQVRIA